LVYVDDASDNPPQLLLLKKGNDGNAVKEVIHTYPDQNSVDATVMKTVFADAFTAYPAQTYALVLWSHADGWLEAPSTRYFGLDKTNFMNISDLKQVLLTAPHFDYIYFDACYMSGIEVLYELRSFADYFIACPTETPGPGAPYDLILPAMFDRLNGAVKICEIYAEHYKSTYNGGEGLTNENWTAGAAISVIKSDELEGLAEATRQLLPRYVPEGDIPMAGVLLYDRRTSRYYHFDMDGLIKLLTNENEDYRQWKTFYDRAVVFYDTTDMIYSAFSGMFSMQGSTGLSVYIPRTSQAALLPYYKTFEWYGDGGWEASGW
jgi:hypothetical protein